MIARIVCFLSIVLSPMIWAAGLDDVPIEHPLVGKTLDLGGNPPKFFPGQAAAGYRWLRKTLWIDTGVTERIGDKLVPVRRGLELLLVAKPQPNRTDEQLTALLSQAYRIARIRLEPFEKNNVSVGRRITLVLAFFTGEVSPLEFEVSPLGEGSLVGVEDLDRFFTRKP